MKKQLSSNLVTLMDYHRIGGVQLARATNIPLSTIKNIRNGTNINPTIETLLPLVRHFNITLEEIINCHLSIQNIAERNKKNSLNIPQTVPVISWEDTLNWPIDNLSNTNVYTEAKCSQSTFALYSELGSELFDRSGLFIIDPKREPAHSDYILVHKLGFNRASIKQIVFDEDLRYLKSLVISNKLEPLDESYKLIGVIIEYRLFLSSLQDKPNKLTIHFSSEKQEHVSN